MICIPALCFAAGTDVKTGGYVPHFDLKIHEPKLEVVEMMHNGKMKVKAPVADSREDAPKASPFSFDNGIRRLPVGLAAAQQYKERLDSIVGWMGNGQYKYTRQYFTYDADGNPVKRTNSYWNEGTQQWDDEEFTEYVCDEDGYVLSMMAYSKVSGQRYDYEYNDKKWGISQTYYIYDGSVWTPVQRGEYKYDDRANITEEVISAWDAASESWTPVIKSIAEYDEYNRMVMLEPYEWNGSEWYGSGEKKRYVWTEDGTNQTLVASSLWMADTKSWFEYCRYEKDFNEHGSLTREEKKFYNKDKGDWSGAYAWDGAVCTNYKVDLQYDEKNREIYECAYSGYTADGYTKTADITFTWTDNEDGSSSVLIVSKLGYDTGDVYVNGETTEEYDAAGNKLREYIKHVNDAVNRDLQEYQEYVWTYDERGNQLSETSYVPGANGLVAYIKVEMTYNDKNFKTEQFGWNGQGTGRDDWKQSNHFTYGYDQDTILVSQMCYKYKDGDWMVPSWGNEDVYDYNTPIEDILLWPGGNFYHKMTEQYSYSGNGSGWDYTNQIYYYSAMVPSSIGSINAGGGDVQLHWQGDVLTVVADGEVSVSIYGIGGTKVLSSTEKSIDLSSLPGGIYIVEAGGQKAKIMKR
jgi:hypothetical protein